MKTIVPVSLLFLLAGSIAARSNDMAFNRAKWLVRDDLEYPYRERMVADLLKRHPLQGMSYQQMVTLLGEPEGGEPLPRFTPSGCNTAPTLTLCTSRTCN